ncbi:hypothetical protein ACVWYQ_003896 [Bradyrhizobium sp. USDA 3397]|nr:hypothetical protein [Bradyrhizobium sp. CCBAU 45321]
MNLHHVRCRGRNDLKLIAGPRVQPPPSDDAAAVLMSKQEAGLRRAEGHAHHAPVAINPMMVRHDMQATTTV